MPSLKLSTPDELRANGLARSAIEKFAGAWLSCFLVKLMLVGCKQ
jgi:hypothetical protein